MNSFGEGYFERAEGSNYTGYGDDPGWPQTLGVMIDHVGVGTKMLEIGCAKGFFVEHAMNWGYDCYGLDVSAYAIREAGRRNTEIAGRVHEGTITALPFPDEGFDTVVSWETLEHVQPRQWRRAWAEMDRVLTAGGTMWHRIATLEKGREAEYHSDSTHVLGLSEQAWRTWFEIHDYARMQEAETDLNLRFAGRDWAGRFFVYQKQEA
jgi:cyclopropane fatty-acyl-phospholipid synthase-like methyltransferase